MKIIVAVNLIRLKHDHLIENIVWSEEYNQIYSKISEKEDFHIKTYKFEKNLGIKINKNTLTELFFGFIQINYSFSYANLVNYGKSNSKIQLSLDFLESIINKLSYKYDISIKNKEEFINDIYNTLNLDIILKIRHKWLYLINLKLVSIT